MHHDHYEGVEEVLNANVVEFRSHSAYISAPRVREFFDMLCSKEERDRAELRRTIKSGILATPLTRGAVKIAELCLGNHNFVAQNQWSSQYHPPQTHDGQCRVVAIGPALEQLFAYIDECVQREHHIDQALAGDPKNLEKLKRVQNRLLNDMSMPLLVTFGHTRVLLGADLEEGGWITLAQQPVARGPDACVGDVLGDIHLVKAPHHGSHFSACAALRECYRQTTCMWVIATHYGLREGQSLPTAEGIRFICDSGPKLLVPNASFLSPPVPDDYEINRRSPDVRIAVEYGDQAVASETKALRHKYDGHRAAIRAGKQDEVHWVSVSLDDSGNAIRSFGGTQAAAVTRKTTGSSFAAA
jgi:hypothetical protein